MPIARAASSSRGARPGTRALHAAALACARMREAVTKPRASRGRLHGVSPRTSLRRVNVIFEVSRKLYPLNEQAATVTGENLRRKAAGQLGDEGVEGARDVADEIERVLVGTSSEPIQLARERADAVFYVLNVSVRPNDPEEADTLALYLAVREIHDERQRRG